MKSRMFCVLSLAFLLSSCGPPASVIPLGELKTAPFDKVLEGGWDGFARNEDDAVPFSGLRFTRTGDGSWQVLCKGKDGRWDEAKAFLAHTTIIGCDRYLNVRAKNAKEVRYFFCKYSLSLDGTFMLALMAEKPVAKAIDGKRLQGKVERNEKGEIKSVLITDSAENIRALIEAEDPQELFGTIGTLRRARPQEAEREF